MYCLTNAQNVIEVIYLCGLKIYLQERSPGWTVRGFMYNLENNNMRMGTCGFSALR